MFQLSSFEASLKSDRSGVRLLRVGRLSLWRRLIPTPEAPHRAK